MDEDEFDERDIPPPKFWLTPENVRRAIEESRADVEAGRLIPVEDVLEELRLKIEARERLRSRAPAAE